MKTKQVRGSTSVSRTLNDVERNHFQNVAAWDLARKSLKYGDENTKSILRGYIGNIENNMTGEYLNPTTIKKKMINKDTPVPYSSIESTMDYLEENGVLNQTYGFYKITDFGNKFISSVKTMNKISELRNEHGITISYDKSNPDSFDLDSYTIRTPKNNAK